MGVNFNATKSNGFTSLAEVALAMIPYTTDGLQRYDSIMSVFFYQRAQKGRQDNYYREYKGYNPLITTTAQKKKSFGESLILYFVFFRRIYHVARL
jgi:hypothetical protein